MLLTVNPLLINYMSIEQSLEITDRSWEQLNMYLKDLCHTTLGSRFRTSEMKSFLGEILKWQKKLQMWPKQSILGWGDGWSWIFQVDPQHHLKCTCKGEQRKMQLQKKATRPSDARCFAAGLEEGGGGWGRGRGRSSGAGEASSPGSLPGVRAILLTPRFIPAEPGWMSCLQK